MLANLGVKIKEFARNRGAANFQGRSRRAINYFPGKSLAPDTWIRLALCNRQPLLPQLIGIEAEKLSGCVKIESQRFKSRSAVLIYRGRVIACVYGSKKVPQQLFGPEGYACIMSEISSVHVDVSSYVLNDEVVLSAASMFHGGIFNASHKEDPVRALSNCMQFIEDLAAPGSIAVVDQAGDPVCLLYVSGGSLLGINSLNSNVAEKDIRTLWQYLQKNPEAKVMANSIVTDNNSVIGLTFSLLGHPVNRSAAGDSTTGSSLSGCSSGSISRVPGNADYSNLVAMYSVRPVERPLEVRSDRFISRRDVGAKRMKLAAGQNMAFDIDHRM
jgi:hypothetical protein